MTDVYSTWLALQLLVHGVLLPLPIQGWSRTVSRHCGRQACRLPSRVYRSRYTADRFSSMTSYCEVTAERIEPRHLG